MLEAHTRPAKYIFLDVVRFTQGRSVEAQSDIVDTLNRIVKTSLTENEIKEEDLILLPTGDGICVALLNVEDPYDIHMRIAFAILEKVHRHNVVVENGMRKFEVRIGVNANTDNLVTDINGKRNIAGSGINMAARIMSVADGNQILVGRTVYEVLSQREQYMDSFTGFNALVKHGVGLPVYQYCAANKAGLNVKPPKAFELPTEKSKVVPRFTKRIAFYAGLAIKYRSDIISFRRTGSSPIHEISSIIWLWILSGDALSRFEATETSSVLILMHNKGNASVMEELEYYAAQDIVMGMLVCDHVERETCVYEDCFERGYRKYCFLTPKGTTKLREEHPDIWTELQLEACD